MSSICPIRLSACNNDMCFPHIFQSLTIVNRRITCATFPERFPTCRQQQRRRRARAWSSSISLISLQSEEWTRWTASWSSSDNSIPRNGNNFVIYWQHFVTYLMRLLKRRSTVHNRSVLSIPIGEHCWQNFIIIFIHSLDTGNTLKIIFVYNTSQTD